MPKLYGKKPTLWAAPPLWRSSSKSSSGCKFWYSFLHLP